MATYKIETRMDSKDITHNSICICNVYKREFNIILPDALCADCRRTLEVLKSNYVEHTRGKPEKRREKGFDSYFCAGL